MKVVVVEDEQKTRERISNILTEHCREVESVYEASNVSSALRVINEVYPDVLILDISLGKESSFDLLEQLNYTEFKIIFVTAHEEYALKAIKMSALDYLLKPVNPKDLIQAIKHASNQINKDRTELKLNALLSNIKNISEGVLKIVLKTYDSIYVVNLGDIIRCESDDNYTKFFLTNGRKIMVSKTLKEYDELLTDYGFFRTHRSHFVNLNFIDRFDKKSGGLIYMKDNSVVPVSIRKRNALLDEIDKISNI